MFFDGKSQSRFYSQSMSCMTSIAKNEMNIQIPFYNIRHLNGILKISYLKKEALAKKKKKILGKQ